MSEQHDCGGDAAAYVLGALGEDELEAFERHMAGCVVCRDEVAALKQVADALPMAAPQYEAPTQLRQRVMRAVESEPRTQGPRASRARDRRRWGWSSVWAVPRPALAAGVAVVIAAAVSVGVIAGSGGSNATHVFRASVGSAEVRVSGGHGELVVAHLAAPAPGRIYELWLKRGAGAPAPSTLFSVSSNGRSVVALPGSVHGLQQVMVTEEPAGGSPAPTTQPVIVAPV
jgi:anti-sigma-K factor RskA